MGVKGALLSYRRNGLVFKRKHKSNVLDLSAVCKDDLLAGLAILDPNKAHHGFHDDVPALFHLAKDYDLPSSHSV